MPILPQFIASGADTVRSVIDGITLSFSKASGGGGTLRSTEHATKGKIFFGAAQTSVYDEVNDRFGIGTAAPGEQVDNQKNTANSDGVFFRAEETANSMMALLGVLKSEDGSYSLPGIWFGTDSPTFLNYAFLWTGSDTVFNTPSGGTIPFRVNNATKLVVDASGNVKIPTDSAKLYSGAGDDWSTYTDGTDFFINREVGAGSVKIPNGYLILGSTLQLVNTGAQINQTGGGLHLMGSALVKITTYDSGWVERCRVTSTGNMGINETSPSEKLQVKGDVRQTGTTGGLNRRVTEATGTAGNEDAFDIEVNIPSGARILGCQLRVDTALSAGAGGNAWTAAYLNGATQEIGTGLAFGQNTKHNQAFDTNAATDITSAETDIRVTCDGPDIFLGGGVVRAIVYYEDPTAMASV